MIAALAGLLLGLLATGPALGRGYVLTYDMVFVPSPPFSSALLGLTGGPARAVPSDAVVAVLARAVPADVLQKLILLSIFVGACAGAAALLDGCWRARKGSPPPALAGLAAGVCYAWNPYVAERLIMGQWALLLGYAGLPWVLRELCAGPERARPVRLAVTMLPAAIGGFVGVAFTFLAAVPAALARDWCGRRPHAGGTGGRPPGRHCCAARPIRWRSLPSGAQHSARRLAVVCAVTVVLSLPWAIPSLIESVRADPAGATLFAPRADTPFGRFGSLVALSGIWNSQAVPRGYGGVPAVFWLLVVAAACAGYLLRARPLRLSPGLGWAGLLGLAIAAVEATGPGQAALRDLISAWAGFAVLRDGQQYVAALALAESIGLGAAVGWVSCEVRIRERGTQSTRTGAGPAGAVLGVAALLAPVILLPGLAWGAGGRLRAVQYPTDWLTARQLIDNDPQPGTVLLLPWALYRRYTWNHGEAVFDPWLRLLSREVIGNDALIVGSQTLGQESAASIQFNQLISQPGPLSGTLSAAGVRYVVIDAGPLLDQKSKGQSPASLANAARLPGAQLVIDHTDLLVFRLPQKVTR